MSEVVGVRDRWCQRSLVSEIVSVGDRLGEDRLGEDRLGEDRWGEDRWEKIVGRSSGGTAFSSPALQCREPISHPNLVPEERQ